MGDADLPVTADAPRRGRGRWWVKAVIWVLGALVAPVMLTYYLLVLGQSQGAAPGTTDFTGTANVSDCAKSGRAFDLVYRCHAVPHLPHDTPGARGSIATSDLIALRPVTGDVAVVERCLGPSRGGLSGCDFYAVDQLRSAGWFWMVYFPVPVAVFGSIFLIFTIQAFRDGNLGKNRRPPPGPSATQRFAQMYDVQMPPAESPRAEPQP